MMRISSLIRRSLAPHMEIVRGPKKKKGEGEAKIESTDIINIFKDRPDPVIKNIREYPLYVQQLSYGTHTIHQFVRGIENNIPNYKPTRANLKGYLKAWKRQRTKGLGTWKHIDGKPDIMSENDLIDRKALYAIGMLSKEQLDQIQKSEEDAAAAQDDDQ